MKKIFSQILILVGLIILLAGTVVVFDLDPNKIKIGVGLPNSNSAILGKYNATYIISGKEVTLENGIKYFGNDTRGDIDGDGTEDIAFIITQETGGSGTFYYLVARLNKSSGPVGSHGVLIGDRISPQTTEIREGGIVVINYADRKPNESFVIPPSIGKSIFLKLDSQTLQFGEVIQGFEGEADPARMILTMKKWIWQSTLLNDGKVIVPNNTDRFGLTFKGDATVSISTDCNSGGGNYLYTSKIGRGDLIMDRIFSTEMYCEGSQEGDYFSMLSKVESYEFTSKGELKLYQKGGSGTMFFR